MNVLLVNKFFRPGAGAESVVFTTKRLLEEARHEVVPFTMQDPDNVPTEWARFFAPPRAYNKDWSLPRLRDGLTAVYSPSTRRSLRRLLSEFHPDIAHLHNVYHQLTLSVVDELADAGIPMVMTLHDAKPACPNYLMFTHDGRCQRCVDGGRYLNAVRHRCLKDSVVVSAIAAMEAYVNRFRRQYDKVDRYLSPSAFLRDVVVRAGLPKDRIDLVPNPVHVPTHLVDKPIRGHFVYFGRLAREKGLDLLLDAMSALKSRASLLVLGAGPLDAQLRARVVTERLPVEFAGLVDAPRIGAALGSATASILPTRVYENAPMSVLEAGAYGVATIASALGGIPELIEDGRDGILVPPDDVGALARAMDLLVTEPAHAAGLGYRARIRVSSRHSPDAYLDRLLRVYQAAGVSVNTAGAAVA